MEKILAQEEEVLQKSSKTVDGINSSTVSLSSLMKSQDGSFALPLSMHRRNSNGEKPEEWPEDERIVIDWRIPQDCQRVMLFERL